MSAERVIPPGRPVATGLPYDFRRLALSRPRAVESCRKGRSDFRVWRKSFASLVSRPPVATIRTSKPCSCKQPQLLSCRCPGRLGATNVVLAHGKEALVKHALIPAWRNVARKQNRCAGSFLTQVPRREGAKPSLSGFPTLTSNHSVSRP